ncbi:3-keto-5-aminohexanoate cleavage protein [Pseudaestuariivita rosea]|uniref:3-keto-5-aminohexanoate cleavage protein n=1 Tax=Pseudaestuariivita rosea TaxID=2763263 RepID=UPI001ABBAD49|nr:3-keto-5-aminohexanoate cleavage protein [Pseudaestuariivita rosea]
MRLQACLNGARPATQGVHIPRTATELADAARGAVMAGAESLHVHPYQDGIETLAPTPVADCLNAIRDAVPGTPVGISTGAWITPASLALHADIAAWGVTPDFVSINLSEDDAPDIMQIASAKGIGIEAGLWSVADVDRFLGLSVPQVLRVLIEVPDLDADTALDLYRTMVLKLDGRTPVLAHGEDRSAWPIAMAALQDGHATRIGFEDTILLPNGDPARDNAALVHAAAQILGTTG